MFQADYFDDGYFDVEYWGASIVAPNFTSEVAVNTTWGTDASAADGWTDETGVSTVWSTEQ